MVPLVVAFAFVYRSVTPAWSPGITPRAPRFFFIVWIAGVFAEFTRPFNVVHQPLYLSVVGLLFGTAPALLRSFAMLPPSSTSATRHLSLGPRAPTTSGGRHRDITTRWHPNDL
jgi:hypothetical protein